MNHGEKLIWAAAFVRALDHSNPPSDVIHDRAAWVRWESDQTYSAAEAAAYAVSHARDVVDEIREGYGDDSEVYTMLREMVGSTTSEDKGNE